MTAQNAIPGLTYPLTLEPRSGRHPLLWVLARLGVAAILFFLASMFAIPIIPSDVSQPVVLPSVGIVTSLVIAGLLVLPNRGWGRVLGVLGFGVALSLTVFVIEDGIAGGFWNGVTWSRSVLP